MNQNPNNEGWRKILADTGRKVEDQLGAAQAAHRLVLHCFEAPFDAHLAYPRNVLNDLSANIPIFKQDNHIIGKSQLATISTTLLPAPKTGRSVFPFNQSEYGETVGYLFDLNEYKPNPARVVQVLTKQEYTGTNNFSKNLHLALSEPEWDKFRQLTDDYRRTYGKDKIPSFEGLYLADAMRNPVQYAAKLKEITDIFHKPDAPQQLPWNEVLIAATPEHISAIAIPLSSGMKMSGGLGTAHGKLRGALAGLAHLDNGMDLPVVSYDATKDGSGKIAFLAQGKEQLQALAMQSIRELQENPAFLKQAKGALINIFKHTHANAKAYLGVDMYQPLVEQGVTLEGAGRGA